MSSRVAGAVRWVAALTAGVPRVRRPCDWQDRAHRIGQTRDVHIFRLITSQTVEENILVKANQKRELTRLSLEVRHGPWQRLWQ